MKTAKSKKDAQQWADSFITAEKKEYEMPCPHGKALRIDILHKGEMIDSIIACAECWKVAAWVDKVQ